ncbi:hypothetical protein C8J57DRAFT_1272485 [Mycena rebaudengoi]|nr:hypothetical protein C8J57DRAFT_1272485 [Mycena rebaudengoi]
MRFSTILAACSLFAASASAASSHLMTRQFPPCSMDCLAKPNLGACKLGENDCLCRDNTFVTTTFECIQAACKGKELADAIGGAANLCAAAGVTLVSAAGAQFSATHTEDSPSTGSPAGSGSPTNSAPPADQTKTGAALSTTVNTAFLGLAAIGAVALGL